MNVPPYQDKHIGLYLDTQRMSNRQNGNTSNRHSQQHSLDQEMHSRNWERRGEQNTLTSNPRAVEQTNKCSLPPIRDLLGFTGSGLSLWPSDHQQHTTFGWNESNMTARENGQAPSRLELALQSADSPRSLPSIAGATYYTSGTASQISQQPYTFPTAAQPDIVLPNLERREHRRSFASNHSNSSTHSASTVSSHSTSITSAPPVSPHGSCPRVFSNSAPQDLTPHRSVPMDFPLRLQAQPPQSPTSATSANASPITAASTLSDAWSQRSASQADSHYTHASASIPSPSFPQDRYICPTCGKAFSRPSSLRIHSHSHTGEKPFRCPQRGCGKAFSVRSNMKRHERGCHADRRVSDVKNSACREILPAAG